MIKSSIKIALSTLALLFILISCNRRSEDFKFKYSVEMAGNYKAILSINSKDSSYKFEEYNFYFDNLEGVKKPILLSGKLNSNDYNLLRKTIENSRITKMKDDYGFSGDDNVTGKILYNLSYITGRTEKFVILRGVNPKELTPEFMSLLKLCNKTMTDLKR